MSLEYPVVMPKDVARVIKAALGSKTLDQATVLAACRTPSWA